MSREAEATAKLAPCPQCGELHGEDLLRCPSTDILLPLEGRRLDGKFRFLSSLGSGGMASVYLAVNERVDREVAIKFLRPDIGRDPEAVARFRSEAKAAGRIGNRHICEILDLGDSPIGPYIVMERLRGIDLAALIRRQGRLAPGYAVRVVRHALEGLAAAHAAGIVHRDLKPGNIFLHRTETGDTIVKLMDFGVSKFLDGTGEAQTASGILLGTPEYMAPEQLEGANKIGVPADIWAIGAILYRSITGHQVFSGPNLAAVIKAMALDEVTPMSRLVEGLPPALEAVIHRCLDRNLDGRYATAAELSEALAPFEEIDIEVTPIAEPPETRSLPISSVDLETIHTGDTHEPIDASAAAVADELDDEPVEMTQEFEAREGPASAGERGPSDKPSREGPASAGERGLEAKPEARARRPWRVFALLFLLGALVLAAVIVLTDGLGLGAADDRDTSSSVAASGGDGERETDPVTPPDLAADSSAVPVTDGAGETDTGEAAAETETGETGETGETEAASESEGSGGDPSWVAGTDRPAPSGTFRSLAYISPTEPGPVTDQNGAKDYCAKLASQRFAGQDDWHLANPSELAKFVDSKQLKRGKYWSTAVHKGRAAAYTIPGGKKNSERYDRKVARPLCVMKY